MTTYGMREYAKDLAPQVRKVYDDMLLDYPHTITTTSILDYVAEHFPAVSLQVLRLAMVEAGIVKGMEYFGQGGTK